MNITPDIARILKCPWPNVETNWPKILICMQALNVASEPSQIAALATVAVETGWSFEPIKEFGSEAYLKSKEYYPYFGRGFAQITWENEYRAYGKLVGVDLIADPDRACDPDIAASIFAAIWRDKGCQALADSGDFRHVRIRWNGGTNGMVDYMSIVGRLKELTPAVDVGGEISV